MDYLPIFLRLENRPVVVVGGGDVALRKVTWLLRAGARVTVIAPALHPELAALAARGTLAHRAEAFTADGLAGATVAVAATDERGVNLTVSQAARARGIPVNVVDDAELSTFIFPAIIDRAPVVVAVSSAGAAPVLARLVRAQIEALLPARLGSLARFMGAQRARIAGALGAAARRPFWERLVGGPVAGRLLAGDEPGAQHLLERELKGAQLAGGALAPTERVGEVYLIGAGPGDADLLTLRALQLLQQADVILYDRLVGADVLDRARRDAERIFVGKESGERGQQERINRLLVKLAREGKRVARLKGGDPFIFGRGGEEIEVLNAHDIPWRVVPGITAALGAAAGASLPLTHRRLAGSVTFVSGHEPAHGETDWRYYADARHTVVFYMAVADLAAIVARLRAAGAAPTHPAALVERATLPEQRVVRGTLADIAALAARHRIAPPALLVTGNVAGFLAAEPVADPAVARTPAPLAAGAVA